MLTNTSKSPFGKVEPIAWDAVNWTDGLWGEVSKSCNNVTIPHIKKMFESTEISHVIENFKVCAGESEGEFGGTDFGDGDFYKWMEGAIYSAAKENDTSKLTEIEEYIQLIGRCQLEDGYISTKQILGERQNNGISRFNDINDFEVYNFGHLFTCACVHNRITGKESFLNIAKKAADYLDDMYQENAKKGTVQTAVCPSHYMGLVELYRTTGEQKYLDLAKLAIELRDSVKNGSIDNQDKTPLKTHEKIEGHAVRANYLYAGVADLFLEQGDSESKTMLDKVWKNLIEKKIYITGGCGALYNGVAPYGYFFDDAKVHQAFGYEYQLPNITAYNETCASIGNVMWAYRMFQIEPKAEYFDVIERAMLNVNLAAINLKGDKFFYENMLRRTKELDYELIWPLTREEYIFSYCCPPNLARTLAESSEYAYTVDNDSLWLGMYGANEGTIELKNGTKFKIKQETNYPFEGNIKFTLTDIQASTDFNLKLRIPGWLKSGTINTGGSIIELSKANSSSYTTVPLSSELTSVEIEVFFDMPVRYTSAHHFVEENTNQIAIERGPLVYCLETPDCELKSISECMVDVTGSFNPVNIEIAGRSIVSLEGDVYYKQFASHDENALYQEVEYSGLSQTQVKLIPYFAWDNREFGEMQIWLSAIYPMNK